MTEKRAPDTGHDKPRLPPRWFVRSAWYVHRGLYRATRGRVGLWRPKADRWGTLRLTTVGRRSGQSRSVILGYVQDGGNLVTLAMNGWADGEPACEKCKAARRKVDATTRLAKKQNATADQQRSAA